MSRVIQTESLPPEDTACGNRQYPAAVELGLDGALDHEPLARPDPAAVRNAPRDRQRLALAVRSRNKPAGGVVTLTTV